MIFQPRFAARYPARLLTRVADLATNESSRIHGPEHWARVAENGTRLAGSTPGTDPDVIDLFALFHDAMRENDGRDPGHGPRAAAVAFELFDLLEISNAQFRVLATACEDHDRGLVSEDPTVGCCWDSDRLDLPRVGAKLELRYFSTIAGREEAGRLLGAH